MTDPVPATTTGSSSRITVAELIAHTVILLALAAAASTLAALGKDSTPAWTALGGYIGFAGVRRAANGRH